MATSNDFVTCSDCRMVWSKHRLCEACAFRAGGADPSCSVCGGLGVLPEGEDDREPHACPSPFPLDVARTLASMSPIVSQRTAARIRLGLAQHAQHT